MTPRRSSVIAAVLLAAVCLVGARCPVRGQTVFVSATGDVAAPFTTVMTNGRAVTRSIADRAVAEVREVAEGDLFRPLAPGLLLHANAHRGLQVLDVGDVAHPRILSRLVVSGVPVELHVVGDVAYAILDGSRELGIYRQTSSHTSMLIAVDVSDPSHLVVIGMQTLPGRATTSRLVLKDDRASLYVVTSDSALSFVPFGDVSLMASVLPVEFGEPSVHVRSFDVSGGGLALTDELELAGAASAVQATSEMLMIARHPAVAVPGAEGANVTLIDIRDASGLLVPGDEVAVAGAVGNPFQLDYHGGILRVFSRGGNGWSSPIASHLETFEASDVANVVPIDAVEFGAGAELFATRFLGDRAFAVTYRLRMDPFHSFAIDAAGIVTVGAELEVSGWNDFLRPAFGDTRLIGIGADDGVVGSTLAVSLYDVTDIHAPEPLLARAHVDAGQSSSALFDHRAFTVLEGAVAVEGPGGAIETGLVLLPFVSWSTGELVADVQIFTFSDHTLTRRGRMQHGTAVERSFLTGDDTVANLSQAELSLFDAGDPDDPVELGRLEVAPDYTAVHRFGDHRVRVVNGAAPGRATRIEVISAAADPDLAPPLAIVELSMSAVVHRTGSLLVGVAPDPDAVGAGESEITVLDLSDPLHPTETARIRTDRLRPSVFGPLPLRQPVAGIDVRAAPCFGCEVPRFLPIQAVGPEVVAVPGGLAFLVRSPWQSAVLEVLDLRDPGAPAFGSAAALAGGVGSAGLLVAGSDVWVSSTQISHPDRRGRGFVRHFAQRIDAADPASPQADPPVNVPGTLVAVSGAQLFTRDLQWERNELEEGVVRLALADGLATVEAVRWFPGARIGEVVLDGAGQLLVSHASQGFKTTGERGVTTAPDTKLSVLDADASDLASLAELDLGAPATLLAGVPGRALFAGADTFLVVDLDDPAMPWLLSSVATPVQIGSVVIDGRVALAATGRFGILRFELDVP